MEYIFFFTDYLGTHPYLLILLSFFLMFFLFPIPEEVILFVGGYLSSSIPWMWLPSLIAGIVGVCITDYWFYFLARKFGRKIISSGFIKRYFSDHRQKRATHIVERFGVWSVFVVRFIPGGIRNPVFFICGLFNIKPKNFIMASLGGALISSQVSFWGGYLLYDALPPIDLIMKDAKKYSLILTFAVLIAALIYYVIKKKLFRRKKN